MPAEGEGRNAVYAARQGLEVSAFDISEEGRNKAQRLAKENKVDLEYRVGELKELDYKDESFDATFKVVLVLISRKRSNLCNNGVPLLCCVSSK